MAKILRHPRVYGFLHVPIQSASDAILGLMKREYNCDDFCHIVDFLRREVRPARSAQRAAARDACCTATPPGPSLS